MTKGQIPNSKFQIPKFKLQSPNSKSQSDPRLTDHAPRITFHVSRFTFHRSTCLWLFVILALSTIAIVPLLRAASPCTHDGAVHYFRVAAMRQALGDGLLFSRYLPNLAFGYGYPFFNYRAPLAYYLGLALHLTGLALPVALNLVYVVSIAGSALTAYLLARDLFGHWGGIVAAVAYAYAPYQFLDALLRANMPESVALPLLPLVLWAFRRLALTGHRRWFLVSTGSLAALYLAHNISSLLFTPFLLAYLAVLWLVYRREGHWIAAGGALALALALTAFFLGPALLEQNYVQLHMSRVTRNNDFHYNFLGLAEIFAPPAAVDTSLMNPPMQVHLGLGQAILGGLGLVIGFIRWRDRERRATILFFALAAAGMIWMSTRASLWLWEHIPLLPFVQFPWRFIGRAILPVALLAGALPPPTTQHATRITFHVSRLTYYVLRITYCVITVALILSAFPSTYPPQGYCANDPHPTIGDVFTYEHRSTLVGVDPEGSYFPVWVKERPGGSPLEAQYAAGGPVTRFDEDALPAGASVVEAEYGPNRARVVVETPAPFRARYLAFYFPGWRATVDGEPVTVTPTDPEGLISFDVPAGQHTIVVRFGSTPARTACTTISLLSLAALVALTVRYPEGRKSKFQIPNSKLQTPNSRQDGLSFVICHLSLLLAAIFLLVFKLAVVDRTDTLFRRPALRTDGTLPGVTYRLDQPYADGLTLIGFDQAQATIPADGTLRLDLYWTASVQPSARYQTVIHLVGADGMRWSLPDSFRPRGYAKYPPTTTWGPGRYALDSHEVELLPGTPPGNYDVVLTTFDRDTLAPLSVLNEQGQPAAPELTLGQVTLTRPSRPAQPPKGDRLDLSLGSFTLLSAGFDRDQAAPGDSVHLSILWRAESDVSATSPPDCGAVLSLLAPDGSREAVYPLPLPVDTWTEGDVWRGQHQLVIPAALETGTYRWTVAWCSTGSDPITRLDVAAPGHAFAPPPVDVEIGIPLGDLATLAGATLQPETRSVLPGSPLTVTLIWRAEDTASVSHHVFLHLLDPEGRLVAQSDGIPADWSRPTTGWLPGEYVTDVRTLTVPPDAAAGDYALLAGLYVPGGERLAAPDGTDAVRVATIVVQAP